MHSSVKFLGIATFLLLILVLFSGFSKDSSQIFYLKPKLSDTLDKNLEGLEGRYGIFIRNFKTGETFTLRENEIFEAASLYKLWVMATVFEKVKEGGLEEDQGISASIASLNQVFGIPPEEAELTSGGVSYTIKSAIDQMITISHNYAALLLAKEVGVSQILDFMARYEFNSSSRDEENSTYITTPFDIALFFEKLYQGELIDREYSDKMLEVLKKQQINDRLPKGLPEGTVIAHKTADLGLFEHDGGIVFSPKGDYIIVVLTETDSPQKADEEIARISKEVYDFFNK